jgi:ribosomal protein L37E
MGSEELVQKGNKTTKGKPDKTKVYVCRKCGWKETTFLGALKTKFCSSCGDLMFPEGTKDTQRWAR